MVEGSFGDLLDNYNGQRLFNVCVYLLGLYGLGLQEEEEDENAKWFREKYKTVLELVKVE